MEKSYIKDVKEQVKRSIDYLSQGSYRLSGIVLYTPVHALIRNIADCFDLFNYGFDIDDYDKLEDAEEVDADLDDIINKRKDVLSYTPSDKEVEQAKKDRTYLNDNFAPEDILNTYDFARPTAMTKKDITKIAHDMLKALSKAKVSKEQVEHYNHDIRVQSIINYAN